MPPVRAHARMVACRPESGSVTNAIETEALTKRFRRAGGYRDFALSRWRTAADTAVREVTFSVGRGELFGLLGENGAGKSTLIRMLSTTLLPTSGTAIVGGHDVVRDPHAVRRVIGLVSGDERSFYWRLTGRQNLRYFSALYHVPRALGRARADRLLELLGITEYADRRFAALSTGTRQKFAIARGMLTEPEILFLDEPTRALDPIAAEELRDYIRGHIVGALGRTVILATHTLSEAEAVCDRVAILRNGVLVELGTVSELSAKRNLADVLEIEIEGEAAAATSSLSAVPGVTSAVVHQGMSSRMTVDLPPDPLAMGRVLRVLLDSNVVIRSFTTRRPTLADIYRATYAEG